MENQSLLFEVYAIIVHIIIVHINFFVRLYDETSSVFTVHDHRFLNFDLKIKFVTFFYKKLKYIFIRKMFWCVILMFLCF